MSEATKSLEIIAQALIDEARKVEHEKYVKAYRSSNYGMGQTRIADGTTYLTKIPVRGSYLDVSCGTGEMLGVAGELGFAPVFGTEIVPALLKDGKIFYAEVHALPFPDRSFDVVTMIDVIEHLIPGDDELACKELRRIARHHILLSANNRQSYKHIGEELHINRRPYHEWHSLFMAWFPGTVIEWISGPRQSPSEWWWIDL